MEPFESVGVPAPDECLGMLGLLVSIGMVLVGLTGVVVAEGSVLGFASMGVGGILAWTSIAYCLAWSPYTDGLD